MVEGLLNVGGEESFGSQEHRTSVVRHNKKKRRNRNSLETPSASVEGQEEIHVKHKENLETDSVKTDGVVDKSKINIGTCELGIVKLGTLEGGKVDFGSVETATMKGKRLESEMLAAKTIETSTLAARTIESETIEAKSTKVEVVMAELLKSETVEMEKVKTGNVEMQTIDAGLTKTGTLETNSLSSETVKMTKVSAGDVKIKTLEAENLKLKTLDLETLHANILSALSSKSTMTNCKPINANDSNFVMVQVCSTYTLYLLATDHGLQVKDMGIGLTETASSNGINYWKFHNYGPTFGYAHFGLYLLKMFTFLSKNGYKLKNASVVQTTSSHIREYIFAK